MKTKPIYYQDSYKKEVESVVVDIQDSAGSLLNSIILDQTVFFPRVVGSREIEVK